MNRFRFKLTVTIGGVLITAAGASAQSIGTFTWQQAPYCNRMVVTVTPSGSVFALDGTDDQCGAAARAAVAGIGFLNPNGTAGLGMTIVSAPGAAPIHVDATIDLTTLSGTWRDSTGVAGPFTFNGAGAGPLRPITPGVVTTGFNVSGSIAARRANGTRDAPVAVGASQRLALFGARGHDGAGFTPTQAAIVFDTTEAFTATGHGTQIEFLTTINGTTGAFSRMVIDHDGEVGIGTAAPLNLLHVNGDVRIGACVYSAAGPTVSCASDARFKKEIKPLQAMLDRVASLEPVRYAWRVDEFPERHFEAGEAVGLVAQDVERVLPELVTTDVDGSKAVRYGRLPLLAVQAIKELKEKNDALERRLAALEARSGRRP